MSSAKVTSSLDDLKNKIKDLPISEIIGRYRHITKRGTQTLCVCPFHDDHSPSMNINDQKGMFYCFVDEIGGDAIKFVELYKKLNFIDALEDICKQLGWDFGQYNQPKQKNPKFEMGQKVLNKTALLYKKMAMTKKFSAYNDFIENRKIKPEIEKNYQLGFAPSNNALLDYLNSIKDTKEKEFAINTALELDLLRPSQNDPNQLYDRFRDRIMFPIWDRFGQVIGFTARKTTEKQNAKYLNSTDSFLFNKKELLYGLHFAKSYIRERDYVILVEGNMDQLALYSHGFQNSLAVMGVALGDFSLTQLLAITKNVFLAMDNDDAGQRANERINNQFLEHGITPKYLDYEEFKDADEFLNAKGHISLKEKIDSAKPFIDVLIERNFPSNIPELAERKLEILQSFYQILSPLGDNLAAKERIASLAKRLGLNSDSATIIDSYLKFVSSQKNKFITPQNYEQNLEKSSTLADENLTQNQDQKIALFEKTEITNVEKKLMQFLVQHPELLLESETMELLDFVGSNEVKEYILMLKDLFYEIDESEYESIISQILNDEKYSDEIQTCVGAALYKYYPTTLNEKVRERMILDLKVNLQLESLKSKKEKLKIEYKNITNSQDEHNILQKIKEVEKEIALLSKKNKK